LKKLILGKLNIFSNDNFKKLTNISHLNLSGNTSIDNNAISSLSKLKSLNLKYNSIISNNSLKILTNITKINIEFSRITLDGIKYLTNLKSLRYSLDGNSIVFSTKSGYFKNGKLLGHGYWEASFGKRGDVMFQSLKFRGDFEDGKKNGNGIMESETGEKYVGQYLNNIVHGKGVWTQPCGDILSADFHVGGIVGSGKKIGKVKMPTSEICEKIVELGKNNKCTYGLTGKKLYQQETYQCVTCCRGEDWVVCVACKNICHQGHELKENVSTPFACDSYCDCGPSRLCVLNACNQK